MIMHKSNGALATMTIEEYERLTDPLERILDETDEYCRTHPEREDGEKMFERTRNRRDARVFAVVPNTWIVRMQNAIGAGAKERK